MSHKKLVVSIAGLGALVCFGLACLVLKSTVRREYYLWRLEREDESGRSAIVEGLKGGESAELILDLVRRTMERVPEVADEQAVLAVADRVGALYSLVEKDVGWEGRKDFIVALTDVNPDVGLFAATALVSMASRQGVPQELCGKAREIYAGRGMRDTKEILPVLEIFANDVTEDAETRVAADAALRKIGSSR